MSKLELKVSMGTNEFLNEEQKKKWSDAVESSPIVAIFEDSMKELYDELFPPSPMCFDSHPFCDDNEIVKPIYDCDPPSINTDYDPDGTGKPKKNNVKLIKKVLKQTAAVHSGGVIMQVEDERVILYSNGQLDFYATGIFDSLGIFDVKITCDRKHRVLLVIS